MSANHTQHYQLSQWEATDKVERVDFNADNVKLDAALHTLAERTGTLESLKADKTSVSTKADQSALTAAVSRISALETGSASKTELNAVEAQLLHLATGTYAGSRSANSSGSFSLSFSKFGFTPILVVVMPENNLSANCLLMFNGIGKTVNHLGGSYSSNAVVSVSWNSNSVSWTADTAEAALNLSGKTYRWFALG